MAAMAVIALALVLAATGVSVWRARRRVLTKRLMHAIVSAMEALDRDADPALSPELLCPSRSLLGATLAGKIRAFASACLPIGTGGATSADRGRAFASGEAVLRDLRDVATGRRHDLVSRA
jgi:hypothetical protein